MNSFNITISELTNSLSSDNIDVSSGKTTDGDTEISLKTNAAIKNVDDFLNILAVTRNGSEVRLKDIAEVEDGSKERESLSFYNGKEAIGIDILKQSNSNTVQVANAVKKELTDIKKSLPQGVKVELVRDNSTSIHDSVKDVQKTLIEGCILAVIVVFIFLKNIASTAIAGIAIPVSIISTFAAMKVMKFSLNTVSLMALSIAVGLLIDDAIVVIENIVRHLHMGESPIQAAKEATSEIGLAVMATTFALVAVFLPIAMINGLVGKFLVQFGLTVAASVLVLLFVAFTAVPLLSSKHLKSEEKEIPIIGKFLEQFNRSFDKLANSYAGALKVALEHRILVIIIPMILLIGSLFLATKLNTGFIATGDTGQLDIEASLDSSSTLNNASKITNNMEKVIKKNSNVKYIYSTVKANYVGVSQGNFNSSFTSKMKSEAPTPSGIELSAGGTQDQMTEGMAGLATALVMGVLFVFLVIAAQFESFIDPLAILLSLPLAIIGAILGLFIGNKELDMMSMIGVIMLMGLVTKNAILLIDFAKQNYNKGMDLKEALIKAGRTRLRPIIMTTLAMIFGMLPTALANGSGSELRAPMAFAIIGGLITSTLLTLLFVPVVYTYLNDFKKSFRKNSNKV